MSSPLKGIERITEDLKLERQKANSALQERARLRIEIETLKQKNDNLSNELAVSKESVDSLLYQLEEKKKEISLIESREENNNSNNVSNYKELLYYKEQYNNAQQQNENLLIQVKEREAENKILISKLDGQENRFSSKDQLIEELKKEVELLRSTNSETEEKYLNCYEELQEKLSENQGLQSDLARLESAEYNYNNLVDSNDSLRNELDNVLNANSELQDNLRELTAQIQEKDAILSEFEAELDQLSNEKQFYLRDIADLELTKTEIINTMNAEIESAKAAKELADSSIRNREFLGDQLQELKDLHQEALEKNIALEQELTTIKSSFNLLKNDFLNVKESLMQAEAALEEEKGREFMDGEIETLRAQLNDVRKQLIRRDLEDEAGSIGSRAAMDREQSGRQVYEGIINELRAEIDSLNSKYMDASRRLEDANRKAARVDQLLEEIQIYKEMAQNVAAESQGAALSASEALERSVKASHDKQKLMHDLHQSELKLNNALDQLEHYKKDIDGLKEKNKSFHLSKLASDRKSAELSAANSRLEASAEDYKQKIESLAISHDRAQRQIRDLNSLVSGLKLEINELDKVRNENSSLNSKLSKVNSTALSKEEQVQKELLSIKQQKESLQRDYTAIKSKLSIQQRAYDDVMHELSRQRNEYDSVVIERDRFKRELNNINHNRTDGQIQSLRKDLEETVQEWKGLEREKTVKDKMISGLQTDYNKEKEKVTLLKMQVSLLEERLKVVTQELSVYRSLDVYHSTMKAEISNYRSVNSQSIPIIADQSKKLSPQTNRLSELSAGVPGSSRHWDTSDENKGRNASKASEDLVDIYDDEESDESSPEISEQRLQSSIDYESDALSYDKHQPRSQNSRKKLTTKDLDDSGYCDMSETYHSVDRNYKRDTTKELKKAAVPVKASAVSSRDENSNKASFGGYNNNINSMATTSTREFATRKLPKFSLSTSGGKSIKELLASQSGGTRSRPDFSQTQKIKASESKSVGYSSFKPSKTDYERARKLLSK